MKGWYRAAALIILLAMTISCRQMYTTSLGSSLKRTSFSISSDTSLSDLVDLASSSDASDPAVATELLRVLAGKSASGILALNSTDKESILNLATTASVDMQTLTSLAKNVTNDSSDKNTLISNVFSSFDTSVDLTAVEVLLNDTATLETAPVESIVLASAAVLADAASVIGSDTLMSILGDTNTTTQAASIALLPQAQQTRLNLVLSVRTVLGTRTETDTTIAGFNLTDLLKGNQS